jgi:hypothetical protein
MVTREPMNGFLLKLILGCFSKICRYSNPGKNRTKIIVTIHEDQHMFPGAEVTEWGILNQTCVHASK